MRRPEKPRFCYDENLILRLIESESWRSVLSDLKFSPRQREVLESLLFVDTETRVAERLRISPRTVEAHVRCMCEKVGAINHSRTRLLAVVLACAILRKSGGDK